MKKLFLFLLLLPQFIFAQRPEVFITTPIYSVVYSEVYQQPLEVKYKVQCVNGKASRKGLDFYTNDSVLTSDNDDYVNNVWDKGHLAPAADFSCSIETLKQTFSYLNCALQHQDLNRGAWRLLEAHERDLGAANKDVEVVIILDFESGSKLPSGATVPNGFWKTIKIKGKPVECYYFPNTKPVSTDYKKFLVKTCF